MNADPEGILKVKEIKPRRDFFSEVKRSFDVTDAKKYRDLLIKTDSGIRYFSRYLEQISDLEVKNKRLSTQFDSEVSLRIEAEERLVEARAAADFMASQFFSIEEAIRKYFPDLYEVEPTGVETTFTGINLTHGTEPQFKDSSNNVPTTIAEQVIFIIEQLHKIRQEYGGNSNNKLSKLLSGEIEKIDNNPNCIGGNKTCA